MIQRRRPDGDAHLSGLGDGGVGDVGDHEMLGGRPAGGGEDAGAHARRAYGRNVGVTICSVPVVGIGTGVLEPTGWMYTL